MEILLFWLGFIPFVIGLWIFWNDLEIRRTAAEKMGQVVGFSTGFRGAKPIAPEAHPRYRVVLRFIGLDGAEYFLIEGSGRRYPIYSMGEFVPIWVSRFKHKRVRIKRGGDKTLGSRLLVLGTVLLFIYKFLFFQSLTSFLASNLPFLILGGAILGGAHYFKINWRGWFRLGQEGASLAPPQIVPVEEAKLIPWAHNVVTMPPVTKKPLEINLGFLKPTLLLLSFLSFFAAGWFFLEQDEFLKNSQQARGRVTHFREKSVGRVKVSRPIIGFYDRSRKIQSFQDPLWQTTPSFAKGQEVPVRYGLKKSGTAQVDRGLLNHWKALFLAGLGLLLYVGAQKCGQKLTLLKSRKKSPIRIRQVD